MNQIHPSHPLRRTARASYGAAVLAILATAALSALMAAPALAADEPGQTAMADPGAAPTAVTATVPAAAQSKTAPAVSAAVSAGLNAYNAGDYATAAKRLEAAASGDPADPAAPYFLGYTYYRMGEFAQSRAAFARAYQTDPEYSPEPPAAK
jgi:Flp pilus assembly protein TadD